jgi:SAM-dependent methyltransferase
MTKKKDLFSHDSASYARFRPHYPSELFDWIQRQAPNVLVAWDAGTGNGQIAQNLAKWCEKVIATDISEAQLRAAIKLPNIQYLQTASESTPFSADQFDLVTVGQAIHWFDLDRFYQEVNRVAKSGALIVLVGYGKVRVGHTIDEIFEDFYGNQVGPFWEPERRYVDEHYRNLPFPFPEIVTPGLENTLSWELDDYIAYISTWSSVQKFKKEMGYSPLPQLKEKLTAHWPNFISKEVKFPVLLKAGIVP